MIQSESYLKIADNTGAKFLMCIKILGKDKKYAKVGDIIIGVVKEANSKSNIKRSSIVRAVIVRTKSKIKRKDGSTLSFNENAAIILNNDNNPKGSRIFGPIPIEIRDKKFSKIVSLANEIV